MDTLAQTLFNRFSAGRTPGESDFRASRMFSLTQDPFGLWCDYHAPRAEFFAENTRYDKARTDGDKSTKSDIIFAEHPDAVIIEGDSQSDTFLKTLQAMEAGAPAIGYPSLWDLPENVLGRATLLLKEHKGKSVFGKYHYRLIQLKRAGDLKDHYSLAAALLNRILGRIQQYQHPDMVISLRTKRVCILQRDWDERLDNALRLWRDIRDGSFKPETGRPPKAAQPPWRKYANHSAADSGALVMIPAIGYELREELREYGYQTTADIAAEDPLKFGILMGDQPGKDIYMSATAYKLGKPVIKKTGCFPPPRKKRNLYFDFEASDPVRAGDIAHVYLIGVYDREAGKYSSFLAHGHTEEEKIFREFIEFVGDPAQAVLYHWTTYEAHHMRKLAGVYPELAKSLTGLADACFDLMESVKDSFYLPAPGYSLKAVAPLFGFQWRQNDCGAMESMVFYWDWLKGNEDSIKKVLMYNEDDCVSMAVLDKALEAAEPAAVPWPDIPEPEEDSPGLEETP
ncbi:MAG: TM0106 family RecB-like putative nuclease [Elusimicrobiaceae bacterium]|nr:TM0106 family RecB-like putative nuclease [Elusimicrobiaceae bacterium]